MSRVKDAALKAAERAITLASGDDVGIYRQRVDAFMLGYQRGHAAVVRRISRKPSFRTSPSSSSNPLEK